MWSSVRSAAARCALPALSEGGLLPLPRLAGEWGRGLRGICTQTPLWRAKQLALKRAVAVPFEQAMRPPEKHDGPYSTEFHVDQAPDVAMDLATRAHALAVQGKAKECWAAVFALKELPFHSSVKKAVNTPIGPSHRTILHAASASGLIKAVELLVVHLSAMPNLRDGSGRTSLHLAALADQPRIAQLLLSRGRANVDARDGAGRTPLWLAASRGNDGSCRTLMRFGADPHSADASGQTPLDVVKEPEKERLPLWPGKKVNTCTLKVWLEQYQTKRTNSRQMLGRVSKYKGLGATLNAHIVAPKLKLTPVGYCPEEQGEVKLLPRGIRVNKKRRGPSTPKGIVNWYSPRG